MPWKNSKYKKNTYDVPNETVCASCGRDSNSHCGIGTKNIKSEREFPACLEDKLPMLKQAVYEDMNSINLAVARLGATLTSIENLERSVFWNKR